MGLLMSIFIVGAIFGFVFGWIVGYCGADNDLNKNSSRQASGYQPTANNNDITTKNPPKYRSPIPPKDE